MLALYFGNWTFWEAYNPANGTFGAQKVAFDGPTKTIFVNRGVRTLDVNIDLYSAWKAWLVGNQESPNGTAWPRAMTAIGGEDLTDVSKVGTTFFLENGWRIQPFPAPSSGEAYTLIVNGNLFTREAGGAPFLFAEGVSVSLTRSNLVDLIRVEALGVNITQEDIDAIAATVWQDQLDNYNNSGSAGKKLKDGLTRKDYIARL